MNKTKKFDVVIIGAGWAGLSAAISLVDSGKTVCIIESARQAGGRARKVQYKQYHVDNGTHIMIGAYTETLRLIKKVQQDISPAYKESDLFERQKINLDFKQINKPSISIPEIVLPAPFNVIFSFLFSSGFSITEKRLILKLGLKIKLGLVKLSTDIPLKTFLLKQNQTDNIINNLWEPLCLAIMNTRIEQASSEIFIQVIKDAFFSSRCASNLLFFKKDLSETFPIPAQKYIEQRNGTVLLNQKLASINKSQTGYNVTTQSNSFLANDIIIAAAPIAAIKLLGSINTTHCLDILLDNLAQLSYQPICTVYLQYPTAIKHERTMQGFLGTTAQWMFHKAQSTSISIIISSEGKHMQWDNHQLIEAITLELAQLYPDWPQPVDSFVIREKRATFTASVNINRIRPANKTALAHIWLAGDYTNTGYPATLEAAARSGLSCAENILAIKRSPHQ